VVSTSAKWLRETRMVCTLSAFYYTSSSECTANRKWNILERMDKDRLGVAGRSAL
jgi:hypothetical protein